MLMSFKRFHMLPVRTLGGRPVRPATVYASGESACLDRGCNKSLWFTCVGNRERKRGLELSVSRTPQQEAEENAILEQAATIQAARKAEQAQLLAQRKAAAPPPAGLSQMLIGSHVLVHCYGSCYAPNNLIIMCK